MRSHALEKMLTEIVATVRFGVGTTKAWGVPATYQINGINDYLEENEEYKILISLLNQKLPLSESTINEIFNDFELPFNQDTLSKIKSQSSKEPKGNEKKLIDLYTFLLQEQTDFKLSHAEELKKKVNSVLDSIISTYEEAIIFLNSKQEIKKEQVIASKDLHEKGILETKFTALGSISRHLDFSKDQVKRFQDTIATLDIENYPSVRGVRNSLFQEFTRLQTLINNDEFKNNPEIGAHISWKGKLLNILVNIITFFQKDYVADTKASINSIIDSSKRKIIDALNLDDENNNLKPGGPK